jgi:CMP-N-acetylneuraminic acid synthetase
VIYVIPARAGSKGFPGKNRVLFPYIVDQLSPQMKESTIVTTDDEDIKTMALAASLTVHERPEELADDSASIKDVMIRVRNDMDERPREMCLLYLTYPQRIHWDIKAAEILFHKSGKSSMLCSQPVLTHPYMCIGADGKQIVPHKLYRRQDYPVVREISHFIGVFKAGILEQLNDNLYNDKTHFMPLDGRVIDVDTEADWQEFIADR